MTAMISRLLLSLTTLGLAFGILFVSVFNASEIDFLIADLPAPLPAGPQAIEKYIVDYDLPDKNIISTAEPVRNLKSLKDKFKLAFTFGKMSKAQTMLDHANDRMSTGEMLIREGKISEGLASIAKAQEYLSRSYDLVSSEDNYRARLVLKEISIASLKHRERLESLMVLLPDEVRSFVVENLERTKLLYKQTKIALELQGETAPQNPFETPQD